MKQLFYVSIFYLCISLSLVAHGPLAMRSSAVAGSSSAPNVCYNPTDNNYFMVWFNEIPYYSILSATGQKLIGPNAISISSDAELFGDPICIHNAIDNQYCVTWTAQNYDTQISSTYFALINAAGTIIKATVIPNITEQPTANYTDSWVSHNTSNDQYLFTWLAITDNSVANVAFAIYDAQGNQVVPATLIPQDPLFNTSSYPIFSSYNSTDNQYFVAWMAITSDESYRAYFAILDSTGSVVVPSTPLAVPSPNNNAFTTSPPINTADLPIIEPVSIY